MIVKRSVGICVLSAIAVLGCDSVKGYLNGKSINGRDISVFQLHASEYCELKDADGQHLLDVSCENLKEFLDADGPACRRHEEAKPWFGYFPGEDRAMWLCREPRGRERVDQDAVRFIVYGDAGAGPGASDGTDQYRVAEAMARICPPRSAATNGAKSCDFALVVGDLIYPQGVSDVWDGQFSRKFEKAYERFGEFDFFMVPGNHDYLGNVLAMVEYSFFSPRWRMPARHFAVPQLPSWLNVYGLDTMGLIGKDGAALSDGEQREALRRDFCGKEGWRILFGHHPPVTHGEHGIEPKVRDEIDRLAKDCPFDLYLAGHDHHQEHVRAERFDLVLQGAGGAELRDVKKVPGVVESASIREGESMSFVQRYAKSAHGFAVVEATRAELNVFFYDVETFPRNETGYTDAVDFDDHVYHCRLSRGSSDGCVPVSADDTRWLEADWRLDR